MWFWLVRWMVMARWLPEWVFEWALRRYVDAAERLPKGRP